MESIAWSLQLSGIDIPNAPMQRVAFQVSCRNSLNVNQCRTKLQNLYQLTQIQAQQFGTREEACAECFRPCPFA